MRLHPFELLGARPICGIVVFLALSVPGPPQDLNAKLMDAIRTRNTSEVKNLLHEGADANARDRNGMTPLVQAAIVDSADAVLLLLEEGADVNAKANDGMTALFWAASSGYTNIVRTLLKKGADVNGKNNSGWTALMSATNLGHEETVRALLEKGADIQVQDKEGNTALRLAVKYNYSGIIDLLRNPPQVSQVKKPKDRTASTPLVPSETSIPDPAPVPSPKMLATPPSGSTAQPLSTAPAKIEQPNQKLLQAAEAGDIAEVLNLIRDGAGVNAKGTTYGNTPLMAAAARGNTEVVRALLDRGGEVDATDNAGRTALMEAASEGFTETVGALLQKGANVNARDNEGWTPLFWAAFSRRTDCVRLLLQKGADVNARNKYDDTALIQAAARGDTYTLSVLLESNVDLNAKDNLGNTALIEAVRQGHLNSVRALLQKGANVNVQAGDGSTALSLAERLHRSEITVLLKNPPAVVQDQSSKSSTKNAPDVEPPISSNVDPLANDSPVLQRKIRAHALFRMGLQMRLIEDLWSQTRDTADRAAVNMTNDLNRLGAPEDLIHLAEETSKRLAMAPEDRKEPIPPLIGDLRNRLNTFAMVDTDEQFFYIAGQFAYDLSLLGRDLAHSEESDVNTKGSSSKSLFSATVLATQCSAIPVCKDRALPYFRSAVSILQKDNLGSYDGTALIKLSDEIAVALGIDQP